VLLALTGMVLVRRNVALSTLEAHTDVAGFLIAVIGVIYGVLVAFVVVAVWEDYEDARTAAEQEANGLGGLGHLTALLPAATGRRILLAADTYARVVIEEEWEMMSRGAASPHAEKLLDGIWQSVKTVDPRTRREEILYDGMLARLAQIGDARRRRILASHHGVPAVLWSLLLGGAIITIGFTYFFGVRNPGAQALMVMALAGVIGLNLFLILTIDYPFSGDSRVSPDAFQRVRSHFRELEQHALPSR
jgi:hypothetical protein